MTDNRPPSGPPLPLAGEGWGEGDQLRALVRAAVARHLGLPSGGSAQAGASSAVPSGHALGVPVIVRTHASHARYVLASGGDEAGPCLIEPAVTCTHCGYCQSHGH